MSLSRPDRASPPSVSQDSSRAADEEPDPDFEVRTSLTPTRVDLGTSSDERAWFSASLDRRSGQTDATQSGGRGRDAVCRAQGRTDPSRGIGQTVAAFANTLGGWLLLGVADDGALKGYEAGPGDFADKIRHKLRAQVEPLPPFAAHEGRPRWRHDRPGAGL